MSYNSFFLRSMPNHTITRRLCATDCACSNHKTETRIGLASLSGRDVEREIARRKKGRKIRKVELIS